MHITKSVYQKHATNHLHLVNMCEVGILQAYREAFFSKDLQKHAVDKHAMKYSHLMNEYDLCYCEWNHLACVFVRITSQRHTIHHGHAACIKI